MQVNRAFDVFDRQITPDSHYQSLAERRLARFTSVFVMLNSDIRVVPSGSWARGTAIDPIHDVDLILVLPDDLRPRYDAGSRSANAVLEDVAALVVGNMGEYGMLSYVNQVQLRNHVVKCYLDSALATDSNDWHGFAVEVMPAFRNGSGMEVPERREDRWRTVDPEYLIRASRRRQEAWPEYTAMVRMLKEWSREHKELGITPLAMEVLALKCLPRPPLLRHMSRTEALKKFFTAAAAEIMHGVWDPAGRSGEIAPGIKRGKARDAFHAMADLAAAAEAWEKSGDPDGQDIAVHFLHKIFGKRFPKPRRDWRHLDPGAWRRAGFEPADRIEEPYVPPAPGEGRQASDPLGPESDPQSRPDGDPKPGDDPVGGSDAADAPGRMPGDSGRETGGNATSGGRNPTSPASPESPARGSRFRNAEGHRAAMGAVAVVAPVTVRPEDPAG